MGIPGRKEQDWWLLCNSTPLVWNRTTYTNPTHCDSRVSGYTFECLTSGLTYVLDVNRNGEERSRFGICLTTVVCNWVTVHKATFCAHKFKRIATGLVKLHPSTMFRDIPYYIRSYRQSPND